MSKIEALKAEIESLPVEEIDALLHWLAEREWERWDRQIEADSREGRLDFLVREAREAKAKGELRDL